MNKQEFKKMLITLAANYDYELSKQRLEVITQLAEKTFGFNHPWEQVTLKIAAQERFFPNIAVIKSHITTANATFAELTAKQQATILVDQFIGFLQGLVSYETIGTARVRHLQNKFNADRFSFARGEINLEFRRREWIDSMELELITAPTRLETQIESSNVQSIVASALNTKQNWITK